MAEEGQQVPEITQEGVAQRLARYDLKRNPRLASLYRPQQYPHTRRCAVLVPLFFSPSPSSPGARELRVMLTLRSRVLRSHADTVAFPGGTQDPGDSDDTHTALREAHEEVALSPGDVSVVAHLPPFFVGKCNSVFPVVGFIPHDFRADPNEAEVARVFSVPLQDFLGERVTFVPYRVFGSVMRMPFLMHVLEDATEMVVWGFTCHLCVTLARAILGPSRRLRIRVPEVMGGGGGGREVVCGGGGGCRGDIDNDEDDDDNVFGDVEIAYHMFCKASRPSGRL